MRRLMLAIGLLVAAAATPAFVTPAEAQPQRDWTKTVVATPEGGIRMGNPDAAVKVVEFVSLTCGHCGDFAKTGAPALVRDYVQSGRASFELRPHPFDIVAATGAQIGRCAAPAKGFALKHEILTTQESWFAKLNGLTDAQVKAIEAAAPGRQRQLIAAALGLDVIAARHGLTARRLNVCLADDAAAGRIAAIKQAGEQAGVSGTPSFLVNGRLAQNVHDWTALEPLLRAQ